jgi:hypothetical protein
MSRVLWDVYLSMSTPDALAVDEPPTARREAPRSVAASAPRRAIGRP